MNITIKRWGIVLQRSRPHFAGRLVIGRESDHVRPVFGLVVTWWARETGKPVRIVWSDGKEIK